MGGDAHKLVTDISREKDLSRVSPPLIEQPIAGRVKFGVFVCRIEQDVCVEGEHSVLVHRRAKLIAVGDVHQKLPAVPRWQWRQWRVPIQRLGLEHSPEASLHDGGDRGSPARSLLAGALHERGVNVERRLHTETIHQVPRHSGGVWQRAKGAVGSRGVATYATLVRSPSLGLTKVTVNRPGQTDRLLVVRDRK